MISLEGWAQPEEQVLLADSVGLALLVVLDTLEPAERLAFVLHDVFKLPFDEIAPMVERTPAAARQLASRARRRIKVADVVTPDTDQRRQREVVNAFFAATRAGDFGRLLAVLDPAVVLRADFGRRRAGLPPVVHGPDAVAELAMTGARLPGAELIPVLVNGAAGVVVRVGGRPFSLMGFIVKGGRIVEIDAIAHPKRVAKLAAAVLGWMHHKPTGCGCMVGRRFAFTPRQDRVITSEAATSFHAPARSLSCAGIGAIEQPSTYLHGLRFGSLDDQRPRSLFRLDGNPPRLDKEPVQPGIGAEPPTIGNDVAER